MRALAGIIGVLLGCDATPAQARARIAWEPPIELARGGGERGPWRQNDSRYDHVDDPSVVLAHDGAAVVAWVDHRLKDVLVQVVEPDGSPRRPRPVNVSRTPTVFSWLPRLVVSPTAPDDVFVLWQEIIFAGGSHGGDILFARSRDGGATFEPPRNLSRSIGGDGKGRIDADTWSNGSLELAIGPDGTLYAAWTEYDGPLWFTRSRDRGATFATPRAIVADPGRPARAPAIAVSAEVVHLAWTTGEDPAADLRIATSRDRGETFTAPRLVRRSPGFADAPKLAIDPRGTLHLAFAESAGGPFGRFDVYVTRSRDRGRSFEPPRVVSRPHPRGIESAAFPSLALGPRGIVHVVWERYPDHRAPPRGLAIATSADGGDTFGAPITVPASVDPAGGGNGSFQGRLMRKLAVRDDAVAVVNSSLAPGRGSRVWMIRGRVDDLRDHGGQHRAPGVTDHVLGVRAAQHVAHAIVAMRHHHDQARVACLRGREHDLLEPAALVAHDHPGLRELRTARPRCWRGSPRVARR